MKILNDLINDDNVVSLFKYGSHVYGTNTVNSDVDYIVVLKDKEKFNIQEFENIDFNLYSQEEFISQLNEHEITCIECISLKEDSVLKNTVSYDFNLDLQKLRSAISAKSSNSWVKAKKKLTVEQDYNYNIGIKSAWHAIRILEYGKQVAENSKVINFSIVNDLLKEMKECKEWNEIDNKFRGLYNKTSSEFKLLAPKISTSSQKIKI